MDHERQRVLANTNPEPIPKLVTSESNRRLILTTKQSKAAVDFPSTSQHCNRAGVFMYVHRVILLGLLNHNDMCVFGS